MIIAAVVVALCVANTAASMYLERLRARERQFLINTALSKNTYEFAVRQQVSADEKPAESTEPEAYEPLEGLYS